MQASTDKVTPNVMDSQHKSIDLHNRRVVVHCTEAIALDCALFPLVTHDFTNHRLRGVKRMQFEPMWLDMLVGHHLYYHACRHEDPLLEYSLRHGSPMDEPMHTGMPHTAANATSFAAGSAANECVFCARSGRWAASVPPGRIAGQQRPVTAFHLDKSNQQAPNICLSATWSSRPIVSASALHSRSRCAHHASPVFRLENAAHAHTSMASGQETGYMGASPPLPSRTRSTSVECCSPEICICGNVHLHKPGTVGSCCAAPTKAGD